MGLLTRLLARCRPRARLARAARQALERRYPALQVTGVAARSWTHGRVVFVVTARDRARRGAPVVKALAHRGSGEFDELPLARFSHGL